MGNKLILLLEQFINHLNFKGYNLVSACTKKKLLQKYIPLYFVLMRTVCLSVYLSIYLTFQGIITIQYRIAICGIMSFCVNAVFCRTVLVDAVFHHRTAENITSYRRCK